MIAFGNTTVRIGIASAVWLIGAPVAGHFLWHEAPWIMVLLFALMAELLLLTVWLVGSVFHEPAKRWELPANPADAHKGWRGALHAARGRVGDLTQNTTRFVRQKLLRRPAKA